MVARQELLLPPHTYLVRVGCAHDRPLLAAADEARAFAAVLEQVRRVFAVRLYAATIGPAEVFLVLRHGAGQDESDRHLLERWRMLGSRTTPSAASLRLRLTSLGGFMQSLLQRYGRERNRRHGRRGGLWAGRYRACLLADDCALLAALSWVGAGPAATATRPATPGTDAAPLTLHMPPLRVAVDGALFPGDESPPGLAPPAAADLAACFARFAATIRPSGRAAHGEALLRGWALGRSESLTHLAARVTRDGGRGRARRLRELDDELGLCGIWG